MSLIPIALVGSLAAVAITVLEMKLQERIANKPRLDDVTMVPDSMVAVFDKKITIDPSIKDASPEVKGAVVDILRIAQDAKARALMELNKRH